MTCRCTGDRQDDMKAIVTRKGRVTIPKALRDRLGIRPGQVLEFREEEGRLVAFKSGPGDSLEAVYGILELDASTDELFRSIRGREEAG